jgi:hypothetical protein
MVVQSGILLRGTTVKLPILTVIFLASACSWAQTPTDTTYQVEVTATASPMMNFFRLPRVPETTGKSSVGYGISVRGMWHPGRLLSVGLLTGYFVLAQDEISSLRPSGDLIYRARLSAVPMQIALSMQDDGVEIGLGIGPYLMMSTIEGGNSAPVHGSRLELGVTFFGSYLFSLNDNLCIGPELRVVYFRYRGIFSVMPSCSFRIDMLRY